MTPEEKAASIMAASSRALITALGMVAENQHRLSVGQSITYGEEAFDKIVDNWGISKDAVLEVLNGAKATAQDDDRTLTPAQLRNKYDKPDGKWGEHPTHAFEDWRYDVDNGDTRIGYWEWVAAQLQVEGKEHD
jgi:hypothetical protein